MRRQLPLSFEVEDRAIKAILRCHLRDAPSFTDAGFALLIERLRSQHFERRQRIPAAPELVAAALGEVEAELGEVA